MREDVFEATVLREGEIRSPRFGTLAVSGLVALCSGIVALVALVWGSLQLGGVAAVGFVVAVLTALGSQLGLIGLMFDLVTGTGDDPNAAAFGPEGIERQHADETKRHEWDQVRSISVTITEAESGELVKKPRVLIELRDGVEVYFEDTTAFDRLNAIQRWAGSSLRGAAKRTVRYNVDTEDAKESAGLPT